MRRLTLAVILGAGLTLGPAVASACPVCGQNDQRAFLVPTIMLSLLPLGLIGGGLFWWRRRAGERWGGEFDERDDPVNAAPDKKPPR